MPVDEVDDAGARDAGLVDAGLLDAGPPPGRDASVVDGGGECAMASECRGTPWVSRWCAFGDGGFSCVDARCVATCPEVAGDVCRPDAGAKCLACERDGPVCAEDTCPAEPLSLEVSSIECRPGVAPPIAPLDVLRFEAVPGTSCVMSVSARGLDLGTVTRTDRFGPLSAWRLPALGGWCIAHQLPTGAIRSSVACPTCTFVIEGL